MREDQEEVEGYDHRTMLLLHLSLNFAFLMMKKRVVGARVIFVYDLLFPHEQQLRSPESFLTIGAHSVFGNLNDVPCQVSNALSFGLFKDNITQILAL